jgi:hypothetical protein
LQPPPGSNDFGGHQETANRGDSPAIRRLWRGTVDGRKIPFGELAQLPLIVDTIYQGDRRGSAADDPLPRLLDVSNQCGFRYRGNLDHLGDARGLGGAAIFIAAGLLLKIYCGSARCTANLPRAPRSTTCSAGARRVRSGRGRSRVAGRPGLAVQGAGGSLRRAAALRARGARYTVLTLSRGESVVHGSGQ